MGKYAGLIVGAIVALLGFIGLVNWWDSFVELAKGSVPAMLIFAGAIAVIAALSEIKDESASKKEEKR